MKPSNFEDHTGSKFGLWLAVEYLGSRKWRCICDCGTEKSVATQTLKHGQTKSCGYTITQIMKELGLLNKNELPSKKGRIFLRGLYEGLAYDP